LKMIHSDGPGSPFVVAAKRLLSDRIDTGLPAGPSECIIFNDGSLPGRLAALDLLIEAEHGPDSSAWLVTPSRRTADEALAALPALIAALPEPRRGFVTQVLSSRGGVLLMPDLASAYDFINAYAPEHLEILSDSPFDHLGPITEAAEILLGAHTPVTLANFCLGPNNVLPTSGGARTHGPLSVSDFLKRTSVGHVTAKGWTVLAPMAQALADYEGFPAHAGAIRNR
jgi:histidinol dehydrogenase